MAAFERSLQLDCKSDSAADVYYCRGMIRGKRGDVEGAVHDFDSALKLNEGHVLGTPPFSSWHRRRKCCAPHQPFCFSRWVCCLTSKQTPPLQQFNDKLFGRKSYRAVSKPMVLGDCNCMLRRWHLRRI